MRKLKDAKQRRLALYCDLLDGTKSSAEDWKVKVDLKRGLRGAELKRVENLFDNCFRDENEESKKAKESYQTRLKCLTTGPPEHERRVDKDCETLFHSPLREDTRSKLLQDDVLKNAIKKVREENENDDITRFTTLNDSSDEEE